MSIINLAILVFLGEPPALFGVKYVIIPRVAAHYPTLDRTGLFMANVAWAFLAVASSLLWVGQFTPGYEWTGWAAISVMLALATPFTYVVRRLRGAPRTV